MNKPDWMQAALWGAAGGAAVVAIVGFSALGWVTGSKAERMASDRAQAAVTTALTPLCVVAAKGDPQSAAKIGDLVKEDSWKRDDFVMKAGWATTAGAEFPNRNVASECARLLVKMAAG